MKTSDSVNQVNAIIMNLDCANLEALDLLSQVSDRLAVLYYLLLSLDRGPKPQLISSETYQAELVGMIERALLDMHTDIERMLSDTGASASGG